jgi:putative ABC transport system permease protein
VSALARSASFAGPSEATPTLFFACRGIRLLVLAIRNAETWQVALAALAANKVKAFLTMLGVVIGSTCIVLVVTVALTGKRYILNQIEGVGANLVYAELVSSGAQHRVAFGDEITPTDLEAVRRGIPQVVEVAGSRGVPATLVVGGIERPISLVGVTEGFQRIRNLVTLRGRYFDGDDFTSRGRVCLLTSELAQTAFPNQDPIGQDIRVGELSFTVIGIYRERVSTFGQSEITPESLIIPFPLLKYHTGQDHVDALYAQAGRPEDVTSVTRQVEEVLRSRHRSGAIYRAHNLASLLEAARRISLALSLVLLLVAFIALLVSGIGIMNIMLVTVTERTREVGIRMATGARRQEILAQFLIEAFLISGTGSALGVLIAAMIPVLVRPFLPADLTVPVSGLSIVIAFLVSSATGIVFGYLPANKAARLQPTESLRYE